MASDLNQSPGGAAAASGHMKKLQRNLLGWGEVRPQEVSLTDRSSSTTLLLLLFAVCDLEAKQRAKPNQNRDVKQTRKVLIWVHRGARVHLCRSSTRFFCVSLLLFLKGGCLSARFGSEPSFCCSERRHVAMTTAGASSHCSGYSPPRPRRCGCSSSKVDSKFLLFTENEKETKN